MISSHHASYSSSSDVLDVFDVTHHHGVEVLLQDALVAAAQAVISLLTDGQQSLVLVVGHLQVNIL